MIMVPVSAFDSANTRTEGTDTQPVQSRCASSQGLSPQNEPEAIAIIGFSAKFPGDATSSENFWRMMEEGHSAMSEVPKDRFNIDSFYHSNVNRLDTLHVRGGHFLEEDLAAFDAPFFSIPLNEAVSLDPQQRGLLEETYKALENAGIPLAKAAGSKTAVFVGSFAKEYETLFSRDPEMQPKYQATGTGSAMLANRLSWFYDFRGPSITLDTACSSSLNALHLACSSLRSRESMMGVVAGCNVMLNPDTIMMSLSNLNFLSPDDRCWSFDHRANGYSRGEGFGVVIIKLLSEALREGDTIRAVIRATGANQDGRTPGITQPSRKAQEDLIRETYASAGLNPGVTRFFEAHGTGTSIGDPTEAGAISGVFKSHRSPSDPLFVGAVKTNIGHLEGASGIASLIKAVQILEKGVIPPNIWFERANPNIPVDEWNIKFPLEATSWPAHGLRRASINSFGYGGANAHVVLDDAYNYMIAHGQSGRHCSVKRPLAPSMILNKPYDGMTGLLANGHHNTESAKLTPVERTLPKLFIWTASDEAGVGRLAAEYHKYLSSLALHASQNFKDRFDSLAYTLSEKRSNLAWKSHVVSESIAELITSLERGLPKPIRSSSGHPILGFVFTGQGAQWYAMGRELLAYPTYRKSLEDATQYLGSLGCQWSLIDELLKEKDSSRVHDPEFSQPLCTALQVALVDLLAEWNIRPSAVVGHSSGEIAAACCVGGLSCQSAWATAYFRGKFASRLAVSSSGRRGSMMAVALSEKQVTPYLTECIHEGEVTVGCVNSPISVTLSGTETAIDAIKEIMDRKKIFARKLAVNVAYHSSRMNDIASEYLGSLQHLTSGTCSLPTNQQPVMYSSVTGRAVSADLLHHGKYWLSNMVSKVRFLDAVVQMCQPAAAEQSRHGQHDLPPVNYIVEIGPHSALQRPIKDTIRYIRYDSALKVDISASRTLLDLAGRLRCHGCKVDLAKVNNCSNEAGAQMLTDLPPYPFNHSQTYWHESRLSRNFRFRKHPPHELLGTPAADWNPLVAKWRNIIKAAENPWIRDHRFNGSELYPAAGMIVMAIEAARQMSTLTETRPILGYRFKDVAFMNALVLSTNAEGVETQFYLRPRKSHGTTGTEGSEFQLFTLLNNNWTENCRGSIFVDYDEADAEVDHGLESKQTSLRSREVYKRGAQRCKIAVNSKQMYENLDKLGFNFGPTFQTLEEVSYNNDGEATATIQLHDWKKKVSTEARNIQEHVIHPTALDGVFHLTVTAITRGGWTPISTMVPTSLRTLLVSNAFLAQPGFESIKAYSRSVSQGYREASFDIMAMHPTSYEPMVIVDGYQATAVTSLATSSPGGSHWRRLCYSIDWKPDIDLLSKENLSTYCRIADNATTTFPSERIDQAELVCLYFISDALATLSQNVADISCAKHKRYIEWMSHHRASPEARAILDSPGGRKFMENQLYRDSVIDNLENSGPEGRLYVSVGRNLGSVLRTEVDALDLLFKGPILQDFYSSSSFTSNYQKIAAYVDLLAHKNPNQRILEIGAGTGGATAPIMHALGPHDPSERHDTPRYDQYVYTDVSMGFFQEAKERFRSQSDRIVFKILDIEKDPPDQGFEAEKYDLVVASCVLHATSNIDTTLKNTRRLLKPRGKLILFEPCNMNCSRLSFVFGLLPGWWLGTETHRRWGPLLSDDLWHEALLRNGFSGTDMCLRDYDHSRHTFSVMSSTASSAIAPPVAETKTHIVVTAGSSLQNSVAQRIQGEILVKPSSACEVISTEELGVADFEQSFCIFLPELESPFLHGIQSLPFSNLKRMLGAANGLLWLAHDGGQATQKPEMGLVTGFGRSVCSERGSANFITLALESVSSTTKIVEHILKILRIRENNPCESHESEYMERDGLLCVNRVVEANALNDKVYSAVARREPESRKFSEKPERALELTISSPGLLNTLCFIDDTNQDLLAPTEVEIAVRAVGINFKNVLVALGQIPDKSLGQECAGVITRVGENVNPAVWKKGDRVCAITHGAFKTYARSHISAMFKIPDPMSFSTAAAIPVAYCTAYYALHHLAGLAEGETVLIHAAAGGVGQVAIQIAKMKKAEIYATVGTDEKKKLLIDMYGVPENHIFSSRNLSFVQGVKRMTDKRGVDVVLNSLAGESLQQSLECVAPLGRFIEIGKKDMYLRDKLPLLPFLQNITFASVDLGVVAERARPLMAELMAETSKLVTENGLKPPRPLHLFRSSEIEKAFRFLQNGRNAGKAVIEIREEDVVPTIPSTKPSWYFDPNATYVIAGGLGGLGRSIARWMMNRGAKHLMILSRSGPRGQAASILIEELKTKGVNVLAVPCDISDASTLVSIMTNHANHLPPIKGCIQGCMVLKDGLLENMPFENFDAALRPKVQGSWNLHAHLPKGLDFYILLSSTGGVFGSRGQSNYATGNTYQDALARYRVANGEKCISLNVGLMLGIGFAAERQQISDSLRSAGYEGIHEVEFLALLDYCCNPTLPPSRPSNSQIVTGISTPASLKSKGMAEIFWMSKPLFQNLRQMDRTSGATSEASESSVDYQMLLISANSITAARDAVAQALVKKLSTALSMPEADIDVEAPIYAYGVDSLVAVEIRYWFLKEFKAELAVFHILGSESILKLSLLAAEKSDYLQVGLRDSDRAH